MTSSTFLITLTLALVGLVFCVLAFLTSGVSHKEEGFVLVEMYVTKVYLRIRYVRYLGAHNRKA